MNIVGGLDIDRVYTFDEIMELYTLGKLKPIALQGYVCRAEGGMISFVPWYDSTRARLEAGQGTQVHLDVDAMRADVEAEHPMTRRTPQERVASMMVRLMTEAKRNGTIAGLTDAQISTITGEAWKTGETSITSEMVRRVAAHFLGMAQNRNREADAHRSTRAHPYA